MIPGVEKELTVVVYNKGNQLVQGTDSSDQGYMIDVFLTRSIMPKGFAVFSENYSDGVLLRGGRYSNTSTLGAGRRVAYTSTASIPSDTPSGTYQLCARIDPAAKVTEANELNNTVCNELQVSQQQVMVPVDRWKSFRVVPGVELRRVEPELVAPLVRPVQPAKPAGDSSVTREVLQDGTLVMRYPDGSQRRLRADGTTEFVSPEGLVMVPQAMQVQGVELPELPDGLVQWGDSLGNRLNEILENILTDTEMQAYRQTESGKNYYELVDWRLRSIRFLSAQEVGE